MNNKIKKHELQCEWTLWAHLPHNNTDWSVASYIQLYHFTCVEDTLSVMNALPNELIENCMLFLMRKGIQPIYEDPMNVQGGAFSYKVVSKHVAQCFKELTYVVVGETVSQDMDFMSKVMGITISPKKNFCIIKIWMQDCKNQNAAKVTKDVINLNAYGCVFKKHPI